MRPRPLVTLLLPALLLTGCAGEPEGPRLAQPTDRPATVPPPTSTPPATTTPTRIDLTDPGLGAPAAWLPGDGWEWESPTRWQSLHVAEAQSVGGRGYLRVVLHRATLAPGETTRLEWWVDPTDWSRVNQTGIQNAPDLEFSPPAGGLRAHRNATLRHVESGPAGETNVSTQILYVGPASARAAWGEVPAGRFEETTRREGAAPGASVSVRLVSKEYGHDVSFTLGGETYRLVAVRHGSIERGVFRPT